MQHIPTPNGSPLHDAFVLIAIVIPHIAAIVLGVLNFLSSRSNSRKLSDVRNTLNGKEDEAAKVHLPLDKLR